jgi:hypothetical protein
VKRRRWGGEGEEVWKCGGVKIELTFSLTPNPKPLPQTFETKQPETSSLLSHSFLQSFPPSILETPNNLRTFVGKNE